MDIIVVHTIRSSVPSSYSVFSFEYYQVGSGAVLVTKAQQGALSSTFSAGEVRIRIPLKQP